MISKIKNIISQPLLLTVGHFLWCVWSKGVDNCEMSSLSGDDGLGITQWVHDLVYSVPFWSDACMCKCVCALPCGLCVLSNSNALCPHSSSLSSLILSSPSSLVSSPSHDTLWDGLCSERQANVEGRLGATLHTAIPLLLATPRTLDTSERKLLNCRDGTKSVKTGKTKNYYKSATNQLIAPLHWVIYSSFTMNLGIWVNPSHYSATKKSHQCAKYAAQYAIFTKYYSTYSKYILGDYLAKLYICDPLLHCYVTSRNGWVKIWKAQSEERLFRNRQIF